MNHVSAPTHGFGDRAVAITLGSHLHHHCSLLRGVGTLSTELHLETSSSAHALAL